MFYRLERGRQIEIEAAVVELLEDYGLVCYPISIRDVLDALGVELIALSSLGSEEKELVRAASKDDVLNVTSRDYTRAQVVCDDSKGAYFTRARFSGGHEVGHIWLEHEEDTPGREKEADYFSGYLLAPHPLIMALPKNLTSAEVGEIFGISEQSARFAMDQANERYKEGLPLRPHEKWILKNVQWKGGGLLGRP